MRKRRRTTKRAATVPPAPEQAPELDALRKAAAGLVYPSESDAPFNVFSWTGVPGGSAREQVVAQSKGHIKSKIW